MAFILDREDIATLLERKVRVQFTVHLKHKEKKECKKAMTMLYP